MPTQAQPGLILNLQETSIYGENTINIPTLNCKIIMLKIYFNPSCSKCQSALQLLDEEGQPYEAVNYLEHPPSVGELKGLVNFLGIRPGDLVRKKEPLFLEEFNDKIFTDEEWLQLLSQHPILIERPIIVKEGKAIIGRPVEKILDIL